MWKNTSRKYKSWQEIPQEVESEDKMMNEIDSGIKQVDETNKAMQMLKNGKSEKSGYIKGRLGNINSNILRKALYNNSIFAAIWKQETYQPLGITA